MLQPKQKKLRLSRIVRYIRAAALLEGAGSSAASQHRQMPIVTKKGGKERERERERERKERKGREGDENHELFSSLCALLRLVDLSLFLYIDLSLS
jgi:hypothetical protein